MEDLNYTDTEKPEQIIERILREAADYYAESNGISEKLFKEGYLISED